MSLPCPVCAAGDFRRERLLPGLAVRACAGCGFLVSEIERAGPAPPEFERVDPGAYARSVGALRRAQAAEVLALVARHGAPGRRWLDVGCSFGFLLEAARRAGHEARGLEPDAAACAAARAACPGAPIEHGVLAPDPAADGSADVVSTLDVLEHVPAGELAAFAATVRRRLAPGGLWVVKVPTTEGIFFRTAHALARRFPRPLAGAIRRLWQVDYEFPHTVYFNRGTLAAFLERAGFAWVDHRYLRELTPGLVRDRLRMDDAFSGLEALAIAPAALALGLAERARGTSDALLALARRREPGTRGG